MNVYDYFNDCVYDFKLLSGLEKQILLHNLPFNYIHKNPYNLEDEVIQLHTGECLVGLGENQWALCKTFEDGLDIRTNLMFVYEEKLIFFVKCNEEETLEWFCKWFPMKSVLELEYPIFYIPAIDQYFIRIDSILGVLLESESDAKRYCNVFFKEDLEDEEDY